MLEDRGQPYVLAVRSNHALRFLQDWQLIQTDPAALADELDDARWQPLSAGEGSKGPRLYEWARVPLGWETGDGFERWLLLRRHRRDRQALALIGALSMPEIHSLIAKLLLPARAGPAFIWAWSRWRRAHQLAAPICHRRRHKT